MSAGSSRHESILREVSESRQLRKSLQYSIAITDKKVGEQTTLDYVLKPEKPNWHTRSTCNSQHCQLQSEEDPNDFTFLLKKKKVLFHNFF